MMPHEVPVKFFHAGQLFFGRQGIFVWCFGDPGEDEPAGLPVLHELAKDVRGK